MTQAERFYHDEESFWNERLHDEQIADMQSARVQREEYARKVFILVAGWIVALFVLLLAQGLVATWRLFSGSVLITFVTVNLIGTLVIVLKYIFKVPNPDR